MSTVVGVGVASGYGFAWRGLSTRLRAHDAASTMAVPMSVPPIPPSLDVANTRLERLLSQTSRLGVVATREALRSANRPADGAALYLGVGASSAALEEVAPVIRESVVDGALSMARLGREGLAACNPMLAFHLMHNSPVVLSSILLGMNGPNAAFHSRGLGTVAALVEAMAALREGDCAMALAGGVDSALHPVTLDELRRDGHVTRGLVPGEGAAVLALAADDEPGLARITDAHLLSGVGMSDTVADALGRAPVDAVVVVASSFEAERALCEVADEAWSGTRAWSLRACFGGTLAAAPALGWSVAVDLIVSEAVERVLVASAGTDGQLGLVRFVRGDGLALNASAREERAT